MARVNNLGMVPIQTPQTKRNKFDLSKGIYTSCSFGEVQAVNCLQVDPDSNTKFGGDSLTYLASLVAPTYGKVNVEFWHYFVNFSDLSRRYKELFAQTNVSQAGGNMVIPQKFANLPRSLLSLLPLFGAHCTVYSVNSSFDVSRQLRLYNKTYSVFSTAIGNLRNRSRWYMGSSWGVTDSDRTSFNHYNAFGYDSICLDARLLLDPAAAPSLPPSSTFQIPLSNPYLSNETIDNFKYGSLFDLQADNVDGIDIRAVGLREADFLIERSYPSAEGSQELTTYIYAFRLHSFGKRLYKAMKGCGFEFDFNDSTPVSLMPFFALYKAYFDCFGLTLYTNWENTGAARVLSILDNNYALNSYDLQYWLDWSGPYPAYNLMADCLYDFIFEFGSMWVTDSQDYVSAHQRVQMISPTLNQSFVDLPNVPNVDFESDSAIHIPQAQGNDPTRVYNDLPFIDRVIHSQLDADTLKILTLWTNRNTIAGKKLESLCRAQGLGDWYDHMRPRFIGHDVISVNFDQVISQSDTLQSDSKGALLGERGGRGQAYGNIKFRNYHNDEHGFLITLCAVVPHAGMIQSMNPAFDCIQKEDFYLPDFDALGWESTPLREIVGDVPVCLNPPINKSISDISTGKSFGLIPRMSKFKVSYNTTNGNFALRSKRDNYLVYNTDKFIALGEISAISDVTGTATGYKVYEFSQVFPVSELSLAGTTWRYPTRYPWLGNFNRIFANVGDKSSDLASIAVSVEQLRNAYEYVNTEEDGFDLMAELSVTQWSHKLQIADSFGTIDEDSESGNKYPKISKS